MQHKDGYFLESVYKDVTFCLSNYDQLPSHLVFYQFRQRNLLYSLVRTCRIIDYIVLVVFLNQIFDAVKFGTKFSASITFSLKRFQVTRDACPFSKILLNAHLFVHHREAELYEI